MEEKNTKIDKMESHITLPDDVQVEQEVFEEEPRNIILGLIAQIAKGTELTRVALPTFLLEPRSFCERFTDFMSHPELIMETPCKSDPVERFIDVVRFYISGFHVRPKGVKKPYNPVLGEFFRCEYELLDSTQSVYVCEQVSHHPPMSSYMYANPAKNVWISGQINPKPRFLGNSAGTVMNGFHCIRFSKVPEKKSQEEYILTMPNFYARGILFGKMFLELGDSASISCMENDLTCDIEFKTKGMFTGGYNVISGKIKKGNKTLYKIHGKWTDTTVIIKEGEKEEKLLFSAIGTTSHPKKVASEDDQEEYESRRLWKNVSKGIRECNLDFATTHKHAIENNQRTLLKNNGDSFEHKPRFFKKSGDTWEFKHLELKDIGELRRVIFDKTNEGEYKKFWIGEEYT